jgi:homoserine kinase
MVDNVAPSVLGEMADALTQPTEQQTNEQIFSLSAAQYNDLTSQDFLQAATPAERSTSQGRRNLAEALATMRSSTKQSSAAEVYTRSLLWDQIPGDVVRTFARMVAESNNAAAGSAEDRA